MAVRSTHIRITADLGQAVSGFNSVAAAEDRVKEAAQRLNMGMAEFNRLSIDTSKNVAPAQKALGGLENALENTEAQARKTRSALTNVIGGGAGQGLESQASRAQPALLSLNQLMGDSQQFAYGASVGFRAISNNIEQFLTQMVYLGTKAGGGVNSLKALGQAFMGPVGVIVAVQLAITAFTLFGDKILESIGVAKSALAEFKDGLDDVVASMIVMNIDLPAIIANEENLATIQKEIAAIEADLAQKGKERAAAIGDVTDKQVAQTNAMAAGAVAIANAIVQYKAETEVAKENSDAVQRLTTLREEEAQITELLAEKSKKELIDKIATELGLVREQIAATRAATQATKEATTIVNQHAIALMQRNWAIASYIELLRQEKGLAIPSAEELIGDKANVLPGNRPFENIGGFEADAASRMNEAFEVATEQMGEYNAGLERAHSTTSRVTTATLAFSNAAGAALGAMITASGTLEDRLKAVAAAIIQATADMARMIIMQKVMEGSMALGTAGLAVAGIAAGGALLAGLLGGRGGGGSGRYSGMGGSMNQPAISSSYSAMQRRADDWQQYGSQGRTSTADLPMGLSVNMGELYVEMDLWAKNHGLKTGIGR